jgi:hypothetical protein
MKPFREKQHTAFFLGVRHVFGVPGIAVFSAMFGFGAFAKVSGFDFMLAVATTLGLWALPGQVVFAELYSTGSLTVVFSVFFLPMRGFSRWPSRPYPCWKALQDSAGPIFCTRN